ncbi:MAG: hypothetical protein U1E05_04885, partial [Patescibacteria group bacterium]|nr:hypothetical protein [Patescibacteria group bacterium]
RACGYLLLMVVTAIVPRMALGQQAEFRRPPAEASPPAQPQVPAQPRGPSGPLGTTPGTHRDLGAQAIDTIHGTVEKWSTTKVNRKFKNGLKYDATPGFNTGAHRSCFRQHKKLVEAGGRLAKSGAFQTLGTVNFASDSGARVGGHLAEMDLGGAGVAALDEGAKGWVAAKSALAFAKGGAAAGTFFGGPPGAMIGGAVGAVAGAVVGTAGYNAFISPNLTWAADSLGETMEPDYLEVARQNREEHLAAKALEKKERELYLEQARQAREEHAAAEQQHVQEPESDIEQAGRSRREFLEALQDAKTAETPKPDPLPDASRPVIPADCTIIATCWNAEYPEHKFEITYHIRDSAVTATLKIPRPDGHVNWQYQYQFNGKLTDNRIRGDERITMTGESRSPDHVHRWRSQTTGEEDIVFHLDGTLQITSTYSSTTSWTWLVKPPDSDAKDGSNSWGPEHITVIGRWKLADGQAKDKKADN